MKSKIVSAMFAAVAGLLSIVGEANALTAYYFADAYLGSDNMATALANLGYSVTSTNSATALAAANLSGFDVVIAFNQDAFNTSAAYKANLNAYIAGGGRVILDDWNMNNANLPNLGATFTGDQNSTPLTITSAALSSGLSSATEALSTTLWFTNATDLALAGGTSLGVFPDGASGIVLGNGGRTLFNGFLGDTFLNQADNVQFFENELNLLAPAGATPLPATLPLFMGGAGVIGLLARRRNQKRTA